MTGISTAQLAKMRSQVLELLPGTCVIQSPTNSTGSMGGVTQTYAAVAGGTVACRVDPLGNTSAEIALYAQRETTKIIQRLTVPYDAPLAPNYRVVTGGNTYEVVSINAVHSWNVSKRAIITEVE